MAAKSSHEEQGITSAKRRSLRLAIVLVCSVLIAAAATLMLVFLAHRVNTRPTTSPIVNETGLAACLTKPKAFWPSSELPGYRRFLDVGPFIVSPVHTVPTDKPSERPYVVRTFKVGELKGYITPLAYAPAQMAAQHAYEKRMKYAITNTPFVPLSGQIVTDNPTTILEAYQMNSLYTTHEGAESYVGVETAGASADPGLSQVRIAGLPSAAIAYHYTASAPGQEDFYHIDLAEGDVEFDFLFRGGTAMNVSDIARLVDNGIADEHSGCAS